MGKIMALAKSEHFMLTGVFPGNVTPGFTDETVVQRDVPVREVLL